MHIVKLLQTWLICLGQGGLHSLSASSSQLYIPKCLLPLENTASITAVMDKTSCPILHSVTLLPTSMVKPTVSSHKNAYDVIQTRFMLQVPRSQYVPLITLEFTYIYDRHTNKFPFLFQKAEFEHLAHSPKARLYGRRHQQATHII